MEDLLAWEADPLAFKVLVKNNLWLVLIFYMMTIDDDHHSLAFAI